MRLSKPSSLLDREFRSLYLGTGGYACFLLGAHPIPHVVMLVVELSHWITAINACLCLCKKPLSCAELDYTFLISSNVPQVILRKEFWPNTTLCVFLHHFWSETAIGEVKSIGSIVEAEVTVHFLAGFSGVGSKSDESGLCDMTGMSGKNLFRVQMSGEVRSIASMLRFPVLRYTNN